ncbi:DUF1905 domain-containing protein [Flavobacterium subsaxonicum]|uniref:DUF1905 domain-containing protein n=1 Tax=Flavobacterium subsaxonicum WB 4.1-42 = DSM 21790 TaxID=1121898 RepID=A0A0A2N3D9_9FLAO|nr:YdeI/OmpD-associated family protein [Flavobacterium subsaxonicum]KGO94975.1 hypothetical protein Q766_02360 [Flavobacterium subsaxonicum WB 4.1-42 = DSM 21790]
MQPLTDKQYQLERFPGKGGWTYISLPEIPKDKEAPFGLVKVHGTINGYDISGCTLMPYVNGNLLMAVKAEIRKAIGKEEGDYVHVTLYHDTSVFEIPDVFKLRLQQEPGAYEAFLRHKKWEQKMCVQWIYSAKRPETTNERIIKTLFRLRNRLKIV